MLLIFSLIFVSSVSAGGVTLDLNCTYPIGAANAFTPTAFACNDNVGTTACTQFFGAAPATPYEPDNAQTNSRPVGCFQTIAPAPVAPSADIKNAAIAQCPKYCGFCCVTPAYNCKNAPYPAIDCSKVTQQQCKDPSWTKVIAANCPNVCGFCLNGGCVDIAEECTNFPTICSTNGLESFVATNCQKTCGLCTTATTPLGGFSVTTPGVGGGGACGNTNANCASWVKNGFCSSQFYTPAQKQQYCGISCGLCGGK